jgi:hypothetical protein
MPVNLFLREQEWKHFELKEADNFACKILILISNKSIYVCICKAQLTQNESYIFRREIALGHYHGCSVHSPTALSLKYGMTGSALPDESDIALIEKFDKFLA